MLALILKSNVVETTLFCLASLNNENKHQSIQFMLSRELFVLPGAVLKLSFLSILQPNASMFQANVSPSDGIYWIF